MCWFGHRTKRWGVAFAAILCMMPNITAAMTTESFVDDKTLQDILDYNWEMQLAVSVPVVKANRYFVFAKIVPATLKIWVVAPKSVSTAQLHQQLAQWTAMSPPRIEQVSDYTIALFMRDKSRFGMMRYSETPPTSSLQKLLGKQGITTKGLLSVPFLSDIVPDVKRDFQYDRETFYSLKHPYRILQLHADIKEWELWALVILLLIPFVTMLVLSHTRSILHSGSMKVLHKAVINTQKHLVFSVYGSEILLLFVSQFTSISGMWFPLKNAPYIIDGVDLLIVFVQTLLICVHISKLPKLSEMPEEQSAIEHVRAVSTISIHRLSFLILAASVCVGLLPTVLRHPVNTVICAYIIVCTLTLVGIYKAWIRHEAIALRHKPAMTEAEIARRGRLIAEVKHRFARKAQPMPNVVDDTYFCSFEPAASGLAGAIRHNVGLHIFNDEEIVYLLSMGFLSFSARLNLQVFNLVCFSIWISMVISANVGAKAGWSTFVIALLVTWWLIEWAFNRLKSEHAQAVEICGNSMAAHSALDKMCKSLPPDRQFTSLLKIVQRDDPMTSSDE